MALVLVSGIVAIRIAFDYEEAINDLHSNHLRAAVDLAEANDALWRLQYGFPQFMVLGPDGKAQIVAEEPKLYAEIEQRLASYAVAVRSADERRGLEELRESYRRYVEARPKWFELFAAGRTEEAADWRARTTTPFGAETVSRLDRQIALQQTLSNETIRRLRGEARYMQILLLVSLAAVIGSSAALYFVAYRMLRPLKHLQARAEETMASVFGMPSAVEGKNEVEALISTFDVTTSQFVARAEDLARSRDELKHLLARMEQQARDATLLYDLSDRLQSCHDVAEAGPVVRTFAPRFFPGLTGRLYAINASRTLFDEFASWGDTTCASVPTFSPDDCWAIRRSKPHRVTDTAVDVPCPHTNRERQQPCLCVPIISHGGGMGVLYLELPPPGAERPADGEQAVERMAITAAGQIGMAIANLQLRETLRRQSIRDPLTGLYNKRFLEESLEREIARATRKGSPLAVLMLDVDHFKHFNDTYGHDAGDHALQSIARILKASFRSSDIICRFGGEEFTVIMPEASLEAARARAEILRETVSLQPVANIAGVEPIRVTISLGLSLLPEHGDSPATLIQAADMALYQAKHAGRNRLEVARGPVDAPVKTAENSIAD